jgi:hypothetical protein
MTTPDTLRQQIREQVKKAIQRQKLDSGRLHQADTLTRTQSITIPLRIANQSQLELLTQLSKRLALSPALLNMVNAGLLSFDLKIDGALTESSSVVTARGTSAMDATTAINPATCCASCKEGKSCECQADGCQLHPHSHPNDTPELSGVVGEKLVKTLASGVQAVRLNPKAVLTPLGKEALRKRGITVHRGANT